LSEGRIDENAMPLGGGVILLVLHPATKPKPETCDMRKVAWLNTCVQNATRKPEMINFRTESALFRIQSSTSWQMSPVSVSSYRSSG
jgi:hypothetical protein